MENKKRLTLPSNVPEVTLLNAIGQKQIVPTTDNQVTIELTGAPLRNIRNRCITNSALSLIKDTIKFKKIKNNINYLL